MMTAAATDRHFLDYAITLAERAVGSTAPNPSVGAVVVRPGDGGTPVIVGEGTTSAGGRPHAEPQALAMAGRLGEGATLYVSLEPCNHQGKTPPCTEAIKTAGVGRVVCALQEPDHQVAGGGMAKLEEYGIATSLIEMPSAVLAAAGHILRLRHQRPFVQLKCAVSSDCLIAPGDGKPVWVTGREARAHGHLLRARSDAILVGSGTIKADNPSLTCRLPGLENRSPIPVVLDSRFSEMPGTRLSRDKQRPSIVFVADDAVAAPASCLRVPRSGDGYLDPAEILHRLAGRGITRLLIEGGPTVAGTFLEAGFVDEITVFQGCEALGQGGLQPFRSFGLECLEHTPEWQRVSTMDLGGDRMTLYRHRTLLSDLTGEQRSSQA